MSHSNSLRLNTIMDSISPDEKALRKAAFRTIIAHTPAPVESLAQSTGLAPSAVIRSLARLEDLGLVVRDKAGFVVGSWGLTLIPTNHQLRMLGDDFYTWCAEDAVGIPAALRVDASVTSTCFHCGQQVSIKMKQGEVVEASQADMRLWIAEAQFGRSIVGCT